MARPPWGSSGKDPEADEEIEDAVPQTSEDAAEIMRAQEMEWRRRKLLATRAIAEREREHRSLEDDDDPEYDAIMSSQQDGASRVSSSRSSRFTPPDDEDELELNEEEVDQTLQQHPLRLPPTPIHLRILAALFSNENMGVNHQKIRWGHPPIVSLASDGTPVAEQFDGAQENKKADDDAPAQASA